MGTFSQFVIGCRHFKIGVQIGMGGGGRNLHPNQEGSRNLEQTQLESGRV